MESQIDSLIGNQGLDSDVAKVIYDMCKNRYRYIGNSKWEYTTNEGKTWFHDVRAEKLWSDIMIFSNNAFIQRAIYWENKNQELKDKLKIKTSDEIDAETRLTMNDNTQKSNILLSISRKFKQASYKKLLLQELKAYFVE